MFPKFPNYLEINFSGVKTVERNVVMNALDLDGSIVKMVSPLFVNPKGPWFQS
jgi:hypothetical protein